MLVVTLGDPHGVGIELLARCRAQLHVPGHRTVLVGHAWQLQHQLRALAAAPLDVTRIADFAALATRQEREGLFFLETSPEAEECDAATLSEDARGRMAVSALLSLQHLHTAALKPNERLAVVTLPIDKHAAQRAGWRWGGQTEYFEQLWQHPAIMILAGPRLRVALATNHMALCEVAAAITEVVIAAKLKLLVRSLQEQFAIPRPRIAVCGLNPHAGDGGLFGRNEIEIIAPALAAFAAQHPHVALAGPLPADTVFYRAMQGAYDAVLAMYHDQGLGPLKTVHFDDAINLSGGLPHLRVSPDHGPARDLYLQGKASERSMAAALQHAAHYLLAPPGGL